MLSLIHISAVVLWERRKARKTMEEIERMLDAAMTGSFSETNFDESRQSALETKFAHYLSAAEASSRNVAQEKDKIKTLIADISHQTKTPIANLLLYSELLMEETLPDVYKRQQWHLLILDSHRARSGWYKVSLFYQPVKTAFCNQKTKKQSNWYGKNCQKNALSEDQLFQMCIRDRGRTGDRSIPSLKFILKNVWQDGTCKTVNFRQVLLTCLKTTV